MTRARSRAALASLATGAALLVNAPSASADVVWTGDFETGDLSQWSYLLNPEHISVIGDPTVEGAFAGRIQLTNDAVWPNGLKRVELNHAPVAGRTGEGATTCFGWSFYLPEALPADPAAEIGYWESDQSYQQMMAFDVAAERITFSTRQPSNVVHWDEDGRVTPGVWHRIAMCILWSQDPEIGAVDVWFDGEQVVTEAGAKTLADDNACFTQVGLLRGAVEFDDSPVIVIDDAVEGDTIDDVRPAPSDGEGGASGAGGAGPGSGGESSAPSGSGGGAPSPSSAAGGDGGDQGPTAASGAGPSSPTTSSSGAPSTNGAGGNDVDESTDDGCGCRVTGDGGRPGRALTIGALAALVAMRVRRKSRLRRRP